MEVKLSGYIDQHTAKEFIFELEYVANQAKQLLGDEAEVSVKVNSEGGEVIPAYSVFCAIKNLGIRTVGIVEGVAASSAAWITLAVDKLKMNDFALMMWHNTWSTQQLDENAQKVLKLFNESISKIIAGRTGWEIKEVQELMAKETWFNADNAKERQLVDEVIPTDKRKVNPENKSILEVYNSIQQIIDDKPTNIMLTEILNVLNVSEGGAVEKIQNMLKEQTADRAKIATLESDNAAKANSIASLENKLKTFEEAEKARAGEKAEALAEEAVKAGKIMIEAKNKLKDFALIDYDGAKKMIEGLNVTNVNLTDFTKGQGSTNVDENGTPKFKLPNIKDTMKDIEERTK